VTSPVPVGGAIPRDDPGGPPGDGRRVRYVQVFGERRSGTNYLTRLVEKNFADLEITRSFGGKHWFINGLEPRGRPNRSTDLQCVRRPVDGDDTLFLVIFRDPLDWLRSIHARPYHAPGHWNLPFAEFIRKPWICFEQERVNPLWPEAKGPYFIEEADNVVRLRSQKIRHLLELEGTATNVAFVNYETLRDDLGILGAIADRFGFSLKSWPLVDETTHVGGGAPRTFVEPRDYPPVSDEDLRFILRNLDRDLEASIGYDLPGDTDGEPTA
jgi:hypothetical protein